eukprot:1832273-Prymnesium_polylepis.1
MGAHTYRWIKIVDAIQFIHAEVPRPPLDKAYGKLLKDYGDWDAADDGYHPANNAATWSK